MSKTVVLIGMSGCGKTTMGRALSGQLGRPFIDLDDAIEQHAGISIREIFNQHGEAYFRKIEWEIFERLIHNENHIIAAGAGLVPYAIQMHREKPYAAMFVYLNPPLERIIDQLSTEVERLKRPLLAFGDLEINVNEQYKKRHTSYLTWSDLLVESYTREGFAEKDLLALLST